MVGIMAKRKLHFINCHVNQFHVVLVLEVMIRSSNFSLGVNILEADMKKTNIHVNIDEEKEEVAWSDYHCF